MVKVIGVRFRTAGKIYFFDPGKFQVSKGDNVIVETARGIEFGTVVSEAREVEDGKVVQPLKPVLRLATQRDKEQEAANKGKEKEAFRICLEKIQEHGLEMKLIDAEYTFDNNKVLFYFTADGRIDFRELVKDLAGIFKTRIELRQIGVRDETKTVGGIGICGRVLCCHSYLSDFIPVSIKMAKEQSLSLNPTKISGVCGRLMCCLKYEEETYEELNRRMPGVGDFVTMEDGTKGEVQSVNVLRQSVKVVVEVNDEKEIREYTVGQIRSRRKHSRKDKQDFYGEEILMEKPADNLALDKTESGLSREELKELELLEKEEDEEVAERDGKPAKQEHGGHGKKGAPKQAHSGKRGGTQASYTERPAQEEKRDDKDRLKKRKKNAHKGNGPAKQDREDRGDRSERQSERQDRPERQLERQDRPERQSEKQDRPERQSEKQEQQAKSGRQERPKKPNKHYRPGKKPGQDAGGNA